MKRVFFSIVVLAAMLAALLLLNGCLTLEQTLRIQEDGSMLASYVYTYQEANEPVIKAALTTASNAAKMDGTPVDFLDEAGIARFCNDNGIELRQYRKTVKEGKSTVQIITLVRRNSPEKLFALGGFVQEDKALKLILPEVNWPREVCDKLIRLCPDFAISLTVVTPDKIKETNGKILRPDTAMWLFTPKEGLFVPAQELFVKW